MMALQHERRLGNVRVARVRAAADEDLLDGQLLHRFELVHVVGQVGARHEGLESGQVELDALVVDGVLVGQQLDELVRTVLRLHEAANLLVGREDRRGGAHLGTHVGNAAALGNLERRGTGAHVFERAAQTALDAHPAQHLEDDVLGVHTGLERAGQVDLHDFRHDKAHGLAGHGGRDVHATHTDGKHAHRAAVRGVRVAAEQHLARHRKAGGVNRMADAVAGARHVHAETLGGRLQVDMVIGRLVVDIEQVVVEIGNRELGAHTIKAQRLEGQVGHDGVDVVRQRLVDTQQDLLAGLHGARDEMRLDDFMDKRRSHGA